MVRWSEFPTSTTAGIPQIAQAGIVISSRVRVSIFCLGLRLARSAQSTKIGAVTGGEATGRGKGPKGQTVHTCSNMSRTRFGTTHHACLHSILLWRRGGAWLQQFARHRERYRPRSSQAFSCPQERSLRRQNGWTLGWPGYQERPGRAARDQQLFLNQSFSALRDQGGGS